MRAAAMSLRVREMTAFFFDFFGRGDTLYRGVYARLDSRVIKTLSICYGNRTITKVGPSTISTARGKFH